MRNMRYTQYMLEMQKKREAQKLTTQEVIVLALVIAAFAYIIFGLVSNTPTEYNQPGYPEPIRETYTGAEPEIEFFYE